MALVLVRAIVLFIGLQLSGVSTLAWDDCCSTDDDDCSGQTDQKPCNDCPRDCPKCSCNHTPFSVPPSVQTASVELAVDPRPVVWTPYEADAPSPLPPSCVFRPPKPLSTT